ncbi:MAG: prephenate dehydratase [Muribaculaceae bacterium]|nr:prephenate dehydratase [Muribaculaceae bacterium]MDE7081582.1 prephenate dehydratase [Muribaculaceae bacterium]
MDVAIQGVAGCFHEAAAATYFDSVGAGVRAVECETFHDLFDALAADSRMCGVVAIENTIAGPLLQNHELLRQSEMTIVGETLMRISHCLCAMPGQTLGEIRTVSSHPMALMQCERYLRSHPAMRMTETFDTAGAARDIARNRLTAHAAICGEYAARLYGLQILERGIETDKHNFTRFLILSHPGQRNRFLPDPTDCDKASLVFSLPHRKGALAGVLAIFSFYDLNLTRIQSSPIVGREWEYLFHIDLTFDDYERYRQAVAAVTPLLNNLRILGEYKAAE